ncbi:MAG: proton-translocating NADH-quinone oxidoreductase chain N, partial [Meiothermus sp.]
VTTSARPEALAAGAHLYEARRAAQQPAAARTNVTVTAPAASAIPGQLAFTGPAEGSQVSASGFTLQGTGKAGEGLEVFEDGTSLGRFNVPDNGQWSLNVPPPSPGNRVYEVRRQGEASGTKLNLVVQQPTAGTVCNMAFSLSNLQAGGTVSRPFRFGGVGSGQGYSVTVKRGTRVIGTKNLPLSAACGWSYLSDPGVGSITYEVREAGKPATEAPLSTINLNVQ